jgi:hypothetical protein
VRLIRLARIGSLHNSKVRLIRLARIGSLHFYSTDTPQPVKHTQPPRYGSFPTLVVDVLAEPSYADAGGAHHGGVPASAQRGLSVPPRVRGGGVDNGGGGGGGGDGAPTPHLVYSLSDATDRAQSDLESFNSSDPMAGLIEPLTLTPSR